MITFFNYCYQEEDKSESPAAPVYFPGVGGIGGGVLSGPDQASSLTAQYQGEMESASPKKTVVAAPAADAMLADTDDDEDDSESMSSWELHRKAERVSATLRLEQPVILMIVVDTHCLVLHGTHTIMGGCDSGHVRFTEIQCCHGSDVLPLTQALRLLWVGAHYLHPSHRQRLYHSTPLSLTLIGTSFRSL